LDLDWISLAIQPDPERDCTNEVICDHAKKFDME